MGNKYRPRKDFVVFRIEKVDEVKGLYMPQRSAEGHKRTVVAVGPKVENLSPGDEIMVIATQGACADIAGESGLCITREDNVCLVLTKEESDFQPESLYDIEEDINPECFIDPNRSPM